MQKMTQIDPSATLASARRYAGWLLAASWLLALLAAALVVFAVVDSVALGRALSAASGFGTDSPRPWQGLVLAAVFLLQIGIWGGVVVSARRTFVHLAEGQPTAAASAAKQVACWLWLQLFWGLAAHALSSGIATWYFAEGARTIAISFGSAQITTALAALMASFLARAVALGAELWQDHREIV